MSKLHVIIATPLRYFPAHEVWEKLSPEEKASALPPFVGRALRELATRGLGDDPTDADIAFRAEANKYTFEFIAAVGGLCRARNGLAHLAVKAGAVFVVWADNDLDLTAEHILRLLSHRQPIVGALYCKRAKRPQWVCSWMPVAELKADTKGDGLLQVAELGGGLKCIHVATVYGEIARLFGGDKEKKEAGIRYRDRDSGETLYAFYQNLVLDGDLLSEDYWLDYLCRCARIPILADTKIKVRHVEPDGSLYPPGGFPPIPAVDAAI